MAAVKVATRDRDAGARFHPSSEAVPEALRPFGTPTFCRVGTPRLAHVNEREDGQLPANGQSGLVAGS